MASDAGAQSVPKAELPPSPSLSVSSVGKALIAGGVAGGVYVFLHPAVCRAVSLGLASGLQRCVLPLTALRGTCDCHLSLWYCRRSRTAVAPLERLKILMQVQGSHKTYTGVWQVPAKRACCLSKMAKYSCFSVGPE